ncbi:hypothetical protein ACS0PU_006416 [Formica fusca]
MDGVSRICFHDRFSGPSGIGISGRGRRSEGGATCSTCPRQVRIKRRIGNSLKFSWTDTVGHACALCGCLVNYVELERPGCGVKTLRERERDTPMIEGSTENLRRKNGVSQGDCFVTSLPFYFTKDSTNGETCTPWRCGGTGRERCRSDAVDTSRRLTW